MVKQGADPKRGSLSRRLPLVFGVSGHRDLLPADVPQLREQLLRVFASFRAAYPHTPFRLLTPLAEGADRLAAEAALASEIDLLVPLPMGKKEYERDFPTPESLAEFRALLASAESHWEIPIRKNPVTESRTAQYAAVGDFIARCSHVLILLWDGTDNRKVGGTAWVKRRREHWVKAATGPSHSIDPIGYGPTIQVVTPRASGRSPRPRPATIGELPPSAAEFSVTPAKHPSYRRGGKRPERPPLYQLVYWAIDSFNADIPESGALSQRKKLHSARRSRL
jgi:hypothetical protein